MFKKTGEHTTDQEQPREYGVSVETQQPRPTQASQGGATEHRRSVLSPAISVKGDISGTEDLVLEGRMEGTINLSKNEVLIGPDGQIKADITALKVSIEGSVTGDIRGSERVVINHSGRVEGNIVAPRVVLEDGCQFKGSVEMNVDSSAGAGDKTRSQDAKPRSENGQGGKVNQVASGNKSSQTSHAS